MRCLAVLEMTKKAKSSFQAFRPPRFAGLLSEQTLHHGAARTNHLFVRAAQAARGQGI